MPMVQEGPSSAFHYCNDFNCAGQVTPASMLCVQPTDGQPCSFRCSHASIGVQNTVALTGQMSSRKNPELKILSIPSSSLGDSMPPISKSKTLRLLLQILYGYTEVKIQMLVVQVSPLPFLYF